MPRTRPRLAANSIGLRISMLIRRRLPPAAPGGPGDAVSAVNAVSMASPSGSRVGAGARRARTRAPSATRFVTISTITNTATAAPPSVGSYRRPGSAERLVVGVPRPRGDDAGLKAAGCTDLGHVVGDMPSAGA